MSADENSHLQLFLHSLLPSHRPSSLQPAILLTPSNGVEHMYEDIAPRFEVPTLNSVPLNKQTK